MESVVYIYYQVYLFCMGKTVKNFKSKNWRIVIPNLTQYKDASEAQLLQLKNLVLQRLHKRPQDKRSSIKSQFQRGLRYYSIAVQKHANGVPHLDILLIYDQSIQRSFTEYDYLYKHGDVTTYRNLNQAILDYNKKQDLDPLANIPEETMDVQIVQKDPVTKKPKITKHKVNALLQIQQLKADSYAYLYDKMKQDPLHFNLEQYVQKHQLSKYISGWSSIKSKLKDMQTAAANLKLKEKPGFKFIDRALIQSQLSHDELKLFDSWRGYQTIVNYLNMMITEKGTRQMKTLNLLISGPPSVGKTSLFSNPNHKPDKTCVQDFCAVYPMGMQHWFPKYNSGVYHMILWNEAKLTSYSYDTILKLLEGSYMDLPNKGGTSRKVDNPLVVLTSNMTLNQMIKQKFGYNSDYVSMAKANLAVRVQQVVVPKGCNLFLLQKLLILL